MSPIRLTVSTVDIVSGGAFFQVTFDREDGTRHGLVFPIDTLAWRAAELGLDPDADRDELIDMLLHEPFMRPELPGATPREGALATHRGRVAEAKSRIEITTSKARQDPLQMLRSHPVTADQVNRRRDILAGRQGPAADAHDPSAKRRMAEIGKAA